MFSSCWGVRRRENMFSWRLGRAGGALTNSLQGISLSLGLRSLLDPTQTPLCRLQGTPGGISSGIRALSAHGLARAKSTRPNPAAGLCRRRGELLLT